MSGLTTALSLGASQSLKSSATGANTTATITVASSKGITLSAGGLAFTSYGGGATAPLTVTEPLVVKRRPSVVEVFFLVSYS